MKKFLLSSALILLVSGAFSQSCPTRASRNNGNNCTSGGTGGEITVSFNSAPNPDLQIFTIIGPTGGTATILPTSKTIRTYNNSTAVDISWCFETDNLGPINQNTNINYIFYIDLGTVGYQAEQTFTCNQATLPITLINFNAAQKSNKVSLTWETAMELNNSGFEVERKIGSGQYEKIAFVDSKAVGGNGGANSYSFEDNSVLGKGVTYYRLRQVDFDGQSTYSEVRAVRTGNGLIVISVYPNPSRGTTNVVIPDGVGTVDVSIDDFAGKSVQRFSGLNTRSLQVTNLKPGMYTLRVSVRATGETITERIAVQ